MKLKLFILLIIIFSLLSLTPPVKAESLRSKLEIPILMYHYVRDYKNLNDALGINLSVSPAKFKEQLKTIKKLGYTTITFKDIIAGHLPPKPIILTFDDGYDDFYTNAMPQLKKRHMKAVSYIIASSINLPHYMTLEQLKDISKNNIEIGDHTWSHPDLRTLNEKKLIWEINTSKKYLENLLKISIISFAYPSGKFNFQDVNEVKQAGYNFAVTTQTGKADLSQSLTLTRLRVLENSNLKLMLENKKPAQINTGRAL